MLDIDSFRHYNAMLGYPKGDIVLIEIMVLLPSYIREHDPLLRYGGDAFALLLKNSDRDMAIRSVERIREAFQLRFHTYRIPLTASIGVANFPCDALNKYSLVMAADEALSISRKAGGNRVTAAPQLRD